MIHNINTFLRLVTKIKWKFLKNRRSKQKKWSVKKYGMTIHYLDYMYHREDGPAIIHSNGSKRWYIYGKLHRLSGPAIEYANGIKQWYLYGIRHREDGPAVEWSDGTKEWWLNSKFLTFSEWLELTPLSEEKKGMIALVN